MLPALNTHLVEELVDVEELVWVLELVEELLRREIEINSDVHNPDRSNFTL